MLALTPYTRETRVRPFGSPLESWFDRSLFGMEARPTARVALPPVEAYSDDDGVVLRLEVPGIPPADLKLEVRERILTVRTEAAEETTETSAPRSFSRSFRLPTNVEADKAEARHEYGVLTVRIPNAEAAKPKTIDVEVI